MVVVRGGWINILSSYISCCCGFVIDIVLHYFKINKGDPLGKSARDWNLTILPNGICTNQNQSIKFFGILRYKWILAKRLHLVINKKKKVGNLLSCVFCCSCGPQSENKRKWKEKQILGPCQRTEKTMEDEGNSDTTCCWCTWNIPKDLGEENGVLEISGIIKTIQITVLLGLARMLRRVLVT